MNEIILFNRCLDIADKGFKEVNEVAIERGYIFEAECCNSRAIEWLEKYTVVNHNTTFYKKWKEVVNKSRIGLYIDQLIHYASTYGSDYKSTPFIPNEDPENIKFNDCKIIKSISRAEIQEEICNMLYSGIALKQETISLCIELVKELNLEIDDTKIKNKEVKMFLHQLINTLPNDAEEMVRYLVFLYTGKTLLIKSKEVVKEIKGKKLIIENLVLAFGIEKLSAVFYRYKPLFLAMKDDNEAIINKLRKLAIKNHVPKKFGYWSQVLSDVSLLPKIQDQLPNLNNFKLIVLLQTILSRKANTGTLPIIIRNGKMFVTAKNFDDKVYYDVVYDILYRELIQRLSIKACSVKLPNNIHLALPSSEKNFIGHLPFGSYVDLSEHSIVGINWKDSEGAQDLDLSLVDVNGVKYGWDSQYKGKTNEVIYSGDMTSANPEATELLYCQDGMPNGLVHVNLYNGDAKSKYNLFFASIENFKVRKNAMIDPNDIVFQEKLEMENNAQICGAFVQKRFYFMNIGNGKAIISKHNHYQMNFLDHKNKTINCYLNLKNVLLDAGYSITDIRADIDVSTPDKSTLLKLIQA